MAKPPSRQPSNSDVGTPKEFPSTTPPVDLYAMSDIRFVMREVAALTTKVDRLIADTDKNSDKLSDLAKKAASIETGAKVGTAVILGFLAFIWWVLGDLIKVSVAHSVRTAIVETNRPSESGKPNGVVSPAGK